MFHGTENLPSHIGSLTFRLAPHFNRELHVNENALINTGATSDKDAHETIRAVHRNLRPDMNPRRQNIRQEINKNLFRVWPSQHIASPGQIQDTFKDAILRLHHHRTGVSRAHRGTSARHPACPLRVPIHLVRTLRNNATLTTLIETGLKPFTSSISHSGRMLVQFSPNRGTIAQPSEPVTVKRNSVPSHPPSTS